MPADSNEERRELTQEDVDTSWLSFQRSIGLGARSVIGAPTATRAMVGRFPWFYSCIADDVQAFLEALYRHHWTYPFDRTDRAWQRRTFSIRRCPVEGL